MVQARTNDIEIKSVTSSEYQELSDPLHLCSLKPRMKEKKNVHNIYDENPLITTLPNHI